MIRWTIALGALAGLAVLGCSTRPLAPQPCPSLSNTSGHLYRVGATLTTDGESVKGELPTHRVNDFTLFGGHPIAVPLAGDLSLHVVVDMDRVAPPPVAYVYGPRDEHGIFGTCIAEVGGRRGETRVALEVEIPADGGGEYLVLVGTNPIARGQGGYSVSATCTGEGCEGLVCAPLGACQPEICPTGFVTVRHPDDPEVRCRTCECREQQCGGGRVLVFDTCVCDCDAPVEPKPVCGIDGHTYASGCFADCHEVPIAFPGACDAVCEPLEGCDLDCPHGRKLEKGCPVCECAGPCDKVSPFYRPVCGTDGLTYVNAERLKCETQGAAEPVLVAALGPCLPFCEVPDCALGCELGYAPNEASTGGCFRCECMKRPAESVCGKDSMFWCARRDRPDKLDNPQEILESLKSRLTGHRTFADACTAEASGWKPLLGNACPSGVCADHDDCKRASQVLGQTIALATDKPAPEVKVGCFKPKAAGVSVCAFELARACKPADGLAACPPGAKCVDKGHGPRCEYDCKCLNNVASQLFDPVCSIIDGAPVTLYNSCMALCAKAVPIAYPGACCAARLTWEERHAYHLELDALCALQGPAFVPRLYVDTACPPPIAECQADPALCCLDRLKGVGPGGGGGGPG